MSTRPTCRHCGQPIPKRTTSKFFRESDAVRTKEQAQRLVNHQIVSVRRMGVGEDSYIRAVSLWDGESYGNYQQSTFCTKDCGWRYALQYAAGARA